MTAPDPEALFRTGLAAAQAGDTARAEADLRACLAADPRHAMAAYNLGAILVNRRDFAAAEPLLRQAEAQLPSRDITMALARLLEAMGRADDAIAKYRSLLAAAPGDVEILMRLGEVYDRAKDREAARAYFKLAWDAAPANLAAALAYGRASSAVDPAAATAVMETLLRAASDDRARVRILLNLLPIAEAHARTLHGREQAYGETVDDTGIRFRTDDLATYGAAAARLVAAAPQDPGAAISHCIALASQGRYREAQPFLAAGQPAVKGQVWDAVSFDAAFFRRLEAQSVADVVRDLPEVRDVILPAFDGRPVIFVSCDFAYFADFATPLARSIADRAPGTQVRVHIMDAAASELAAAADVVRALRQIVIGLSTEWTGLRDAPWESRRRYYHAIRFVRFHQFMMTCQGPAWLMDADALFRGSPNMVFAAGTGADAAFRVFTAQFDPWRQFSAAVVGAAPTAPARRYFHLVAAYIADLHRRDGLRWGVDQLAMFCSYAHLKDEGRAPQVASLGPRIVDQAFKDDSAVWLTSGTRKHAAAKTEGAGAETARHDGHDRYRALLARYTGPPAVDLPPG